MSMCFNMGNRGKHVMIPRYIVFNAYISADSFKAWFQQSAWPMWALHLARHRAVLVHAGAGPAGYTGLCCKEWRYVWRQGLQTLYKDWKTDWLHGVACHVPTPWWPIAAERRGTAHVDFEDIVSRFLTFANLAVTLKELTLWHIHVHVPFLLLFYCFYLKLKYTIL